MLVDLTKEQIKLLVDWTDEALNTNRAADAWLLEQESRGRGDKTEERNCLQAERDGLLALKAKLNAYQPLEAIKAPDTEDTILSRLKIDNNCDIRAKDPVWGWTPIVTPNGSEYRLYCLEQKIEVFKASPFTRLGDHELCHPDMFVWLTTTLGLTPGA